MIREQTPAEIVEAIKRKLEAATFASEIAATEWLKSESEDDDHYREAQSQYQLRNEHMRTIYGLVDHLAAAVTPDIDHDTNITFAAPVAGEIRAAPTQIADGCVSVPIEALCEVLAWVELDDHLNDEMRTYLLVLQALTHDAMSGEGVTS